MHLIVPFAGPLSEAGSTALRGLELPRLQALLSRWTEVARDDGDVWSFTPPHERALAQALGWSAPDGCLPWAAWSAAADGVPEASTPGRAWGLLSPVHWHLGTHQVSLTDPATLLLDDATSRALLAAVQALFTSEGFEMVFGTATRWYAAHPLLAGLRCASLDRVIGRNVDGWLVESSADNPGLRLLRRLQNEVQMLLHEHPINERRQEQGLLPVNSFWLSGCGLAQAVRGAVPTVDARLRAPALAGDWAAWAKAWDTLDGGPIAGLLAAPSSASTSDGSAAPRLTLCGERGSASFAPRAGRAALAWQRMRSLWAGATPAAVLEAL